MRDRKSLFLLIVALIIVTISFVLISVWGYHFYYGNKKQAPQNGKQKNIAIKKESQHDSVQSLLKTFPSDYENDFDRALSDSSIDKDLAAKIIEYNRLKSDIAEAIRKKHLEKEMNEASEKIAQLQQSIEDLKNKNDTIIRENERLNLRIKDLISKNGTSAIPPKKSEKNSVSNPARRLPVLVSHLRFAAYSLNNKNTVTNKAAEAQRFAGSFEVNIKPYNTDNSIYVVIVQPDGKILNDGGSSKFFMSQSGKKIYSARVHFENKKDNGSRLYFTIDAHNFQKGKYAMQIYHQGVMIGRLTRTLI